MHRTASPLMACSADRLQVVRLAEAAQDSDRRIVQADTDADTRGAEVAEPEGQLDQLGDVGMLAAFGGTPLAAEDPVCAEVFDELAWKLFGSFSFGSPIGDPLVENLVEQGAVAVDPRFYSHRHARTASRLCLTSSRRSLPDDVRGREPGARKITSAGTTPH